MMVVYAKDKPRSAIISARSRRLALNQGYQRTHSKIIRHMVCTGALASNQQLSRRRPTRLAHRCTPADRRRANEEPGTAHTDAVELAPTIHHRLRAITATTAPTYASSSRRSRLSSVAMLEAAEHVAAGALDLGRLEQRDDRIRQLAELAQSFKGHMAYTSLGFVEAYKRGVLNFGFRRTLTNESQYDLTIRLPPRRPSDGEEVLGYINSCNRKRITMRFNRQQLTRFA